MNGYQCYKKRILERQDGDEFDDYSWERDLSIKEDALCGEEHVLTLPEFAVLLGLYEQKPTKTNRRTSLFKDPLMRKVHKLLVRAFVHRTGSRERCQQPDLWLISSFEDGHFVNVAWVIAEYLYKRSPGIKENSDIYGGHYVTKIAKSLGCLVDEEVNKCSDPIECKEWAAKNFTKEFDMENMSLKQPVLLREPIRVENEQRDEPSGLNSSWGD
ncbi:hypothetical protein Tco_1376667 [Tanacetum coccineum]